MKKYQNEIEEFQVNFRDCQNERIVLYGIGRYTAALVEGIKDFNFVGLMDKDPKNRGKIYFGLPVLDIAEAEQQADLIIINTSETYWNVIFHRISSCRLPIYYKNGKRAQKHQIQKTENPFRLLSMQQLEYMAQRVDVISFDFFDTLFMRKTMYPRDVFQILEIQNKDIWGDELTFCEKRSRYILELGGNYTLDDLYQRLVMEGVVPAEKLQVSIEREIDLEKKLLSPRGEMISFVRRLIRQGKKVYLISDMYLPKRFYTMALKEHNIDIPKENVLISCELNKAKIDGSLWHFFVNTIADGQRLLHIGDNEAADVETAELYGIQTYLAPNPWKVIIQSGLQKSISFITGLYDSTIAGIVMQRLLNNPYKTFNEYGKFRIHSNEEMGYLIFGPVILTFLLWIRECAQKDNIHTLIFMSRDGFFLKQDYDFLQYLLPGGPDSCYLGISRQLAMMAAIQSMSDLQEYMRIPYSGSIQELFEDRLEIQLEECGDFRCIDDYLDEYQDEIKERISIIRKNYQRYLAQLDLKTDSAIIDLGYYGNNQYYLNKVLYQTGKEEKTLDGYYFNANLTAENENNGKQRMRACFQREDDPSGHCSSVYKWMIMLESFLTAPHGMVKAVDEEGNFICADKKQNQKKFKDKEEMNQGVKNYIRDWAETFGKIEMPIQTEFAEKYFGNAIEDGYEIAESVKRSFYNDNAMMNRMESQLFY